MAEPEQISDSDESRLRALAEDIAWCDLSSALSDMEEALLLAMQATQHLVEEWDENGLDEFSFASENT